MGFHVNLGECRWFVKHMEHLSRLESYKVGGGLGFKI